jgi:hypothetical protein
MYLSESLPGSAPLNQSTNFMIVEFRYGPAGSTDQKLARVRNIRIRATDKCVKRIKPVNQVGFDQEIKCPINGRWRSFVPVLIQAIQNVVRANRLMAVPNQFENSFSLRRESQAALPANSLGIPYRLLDTAVVVVFVIGRFAGWQGFAHCVLRCRIGT